MTRSAIVIGAGITGVSAAEWLRRAGVSVTLVDRILPGRPDQASYGNAGLLARCAGIPISEPGLIFKAPRMLLDPNSPLFLKWGYLPRLLPWLLPFLRNTAPSRHRPIVQALAALTSDSVDQHLALSRGTPAESYIRQGDYAYYYRSRRDFAHDAAEISLRRAAGFDPVELDREALHARDPHLSDAYNFAALYPDHGWLTSPGDYVAALAEHFMAQGGNFVQGEVTDLAEGRVRLLGGREITADRIILTAGAWSGGLARKLGMTARLESERGYHLFLHKPSHMPANPFMVSDAKFVVTPMQDGLRCAGIVEFGGLDAPPSRAPFELLRKRIHEVYPDLTWQSESEWMGHRPSTPDSLPHLGPIPGAPSIIAAFGGQHVGLTIGPKLGRIAADLACGRQPNLPLAPYDPARFG